MANMICNMLLPSRGANDKKSSSSSGSSTPPATSAGTSTGGAAGIMTGAATDALNGIVLGEGVVACSVAPASSSNTVSPFELQNLSISYYPQRGTITLMGGSQAQADMIENFIKANDKYLWENQTKCGCC